jgi:hypothetical protein
MIKHRDQCGKAINSNFKRLFLGLNGEDSYAIIITLRA